MRLRLVLLTGLAALVLAPPARPADLQQVERKIVKEPAYQSKAPRYCLLVFGPEAKDKVWLVQDGDVLYVDRNGDGDLTEEGNRVQRKEGEGDYLAWEAGDLKIGGLTHTGLMVGRMKLSPESVGNDKEFERIKRANPEPWSWVIRINA